MRTTDVMPCFAVGASQHKGIGGSAPIITYTRGTEIVDETPDAWAIRGTLEVGGHKFDTIERAGGYVALKPGTYMAFMESSKNSGSWTDAAGKAIKAKDAAATPGAKFTGRRQLRPQHNQTNSKGVKAAILVHAGNKPSHFLGCIGVGEKSAAGIEKSGTSVATMFKLLGGFTEGKAVYLKVVGERPPATKPVAP
ncbi:MAG: hypothetical protein IT555_04980 [Acetobacteraceae bacterium]|nr:hypothetical protein [Acetobacteraceae bacterium]